MLVKRFRGRVVQKMRQVRAGIELIFVSKSYGAPRERKVVTQAAWNRHGSETYEDGKSVEDFRTPAAKGHAA